MIIIGFIVTGFRCGHPECSRSSFWSAQVLLGIANAQGSKSPESGKEGSGSKNPLFPTNPEKGSLSQKTPFLYRAPQGKMGFSGSSHPFQGWCETGVFRPRTLFS